MWTTLSASFKSLVCGISLSGSFRYEEWLPIHYLGRKEVVSGDLLDYYYNGSYSTSHRVTGSACYYVCLKVDYTVSDGEVIVSVNVAPSAPL